MDAATMFPSSYQWNGLFLAIFDFTIRIMSRLVATATGTWTGMAEHASSWSQLLPSRDLHVLVSKWNHATDTLSFGSAIVSESNDGAFFFDRSHGILCHLPSLSSMSSSTSRGVAGIPDLPFFNVVLISACLLYIVYRAYSYGRATVHNEGPTGTVAEIVASLSIENEELQATIERLTAADSNNKGASSVASGVYVFNAGTAPSAPTSKDDFLPTTSDGLLTLLPATPNTSTVDLLGAAPSHGGYPTPVGRFLDGSTTKSASRTDDSPDNHTARRRRRSLSADGARRLRRKTRTVETGLFDFAV